MHVEECYIILTEPNMWIAHTDSETWRKHSLPKAREGTTCRDCQAVPVGSGGIWLLKDGLFIPSHRQ